MKVIQFSVIFLNEFKPWIKVHIPNPNSIINKMDETIKLLEKVMVRVAV